MRIGHLRFRPAGARADQRRSEKVKRLLVKAAPVGRLISLLPLGQHDRGHAFVT